MGKRREYYRRQGHLARLENQRFKPNLDIPSLSRYH